MWYRNYKLIVDFKIPTSESVRVCSNFKRGYVMNTGKRKTLDIADKSSLFTYTPYNAAWLIGVAELQAVQLP